MNGNVRKTVAGGLAALMMTAAIGSIAAGTAIADPTDTTTITLNGNKNVMNGHTYTAYKIGKFTNVTIADGVANGTIEPDGEYTTALEAAVRGAGLNWGTGTEYTSAVDALARCDNAETIRNVVNAFAKTGSLTGGTEVEETDPSDGTVEIGGLTEGWYIVTDDLGNAILMGTKITHGDQTATQFGTAAGAKTTLGTANIKAAGTDLVKTVNGVEQTSESQKVPVNYKVAISFPDSSTTNGEKATWKFTDAITGGTFTGSVTFQIANDAEGTGATDAGVEAVDIDGQTSFEINLKDKGLLGKAANDGKYLILSYQGTGNKTTTVNDAKSEGTDNWGTNFTPGEDTTTVYSYNLNLHKVNAVKNSEAVDGAKFNLKDTESNKWLMADGTWSGSEPGEGQFTTNASGDITFSGLGEGTYEITETAAGPDFMIGTDGTVKFTVTINDANDDGTLAAGDVTVQGDTDASVPGESVDVQVKDNPTIGHLAETGVDSMYIYTAVGVFAVALVTVGAVMTVVNRRKA